MTPAGLREALRAAGNDKNFPGVLSDAVVDLLANHPAVRNAIAELLEVETAKIRAERDAAVRHAESARRDARHLETVLKAVAGRWKKDMPHG